MSVFKHKISPFYHYDFRFGRRRFHGSTGCKNRREAEQVERAERDKAKCLVETERSASAGISLQLDRVAERYWQEVGQHHAGADNTERDLARLVEYFGKPKLLSEINDNDVSKLVAWRRAQRAAPHNPPKNRRLDDYPFITPATVNRSTTEVLKKLFTHAKTAWRIRFDNEPNWKVHLLKEPEERVRELVGDEAARLKAAIRDDYAPFFAFVHATGLRREECVDLRWREVNREADQIVRRGKGGKRVTAPITSRVRDILLLCHGHHHEFVFTYVAARTIRPRKKGEPYKRTGNHTNKGEMYVATRDQEERIKGNRYPLTLEGVDSTWRRTRKKAGVEDFRFHDFRHDLATKVLRKTGNLKLVSRMLNHADLKTTMRYAHVLDEDVAAALEDLHFDSGSEAGELKKSGADSQNESRSRTFKPV